MARRELPIVLGLLAACGGDVRRTVALPEAALRDEVKTLALVVERGASLEGAVYDRRGGAPIERELELGDGALHATVLSYLSDAESLNLRVAELGSAGPTSAPPAFERGFRRALDVDEDWLETPTLVPPIRDAPLPALRAPVDCSEAGARRIALIDPMIDLTQIAATGEDRALAAGVLGASAKLYEVRGGVMAPRALPPEVRSPLGLESDGVDAWLLDARHVLMRLDLAGNVLETGEPGPFDALVRSPGDAVYAWGPTGVFALARGSTRARALSGTDFPARVGALAVESDARMIAADEVNVYLLGASGRWARSFSIPDGNAIRAVAIDAERAYALTGRNLWVKADAGWEAVEDAATTVDRAGVIALGEGRVSVYGDNGFLEILPRRPPPTVWCTVATANSRYIERCSREPGGAAMFCGDDYDAAQASSLLLRVSIPR